VLTFGVAIGLVLGLLAGGRIEHLSRIRLRVVQAIFIGLLLRYATQWAIQGGNEPIEALRLPLFAAAFAALLFGLWENREQPGLSLAFVGVLMNAVAMTVNGGHMPVWYTSAEVAGIGPEIPLSSFHILLGGPGGAALPSDFLLRAGPLGDIIPVGLPFYRDVASIGDVFLVSGLAFFLFASLVRTPAELDEASEAAIRRRLTSIQPWRRGAAAEAAGRAANAQALVGAASLERPLVLGGATPGSEGSAVARVPAAAIPSVPAILERVRRHPYVRLALDGSFSALWMGQLVSLLGDRVHQVALAFLILGATGSPVAVGAAFFAATLPNLLFGPFAGALVDRWDHREVMIVSDLLRAGLVLLIPVAAMTDVILVYPLVFLVTTVSIFFRPAKGAILPRMVSADDLTVANSALWIGETFADIGGYALAGLFVAVLGPQLPLAFWVDAVTYVGSALLIASISVAPLAERGSEAVRGVGSFLAEVRDGWRYLRGEAVLLANTLQAVVGQFMLGVFLTLTPVYAAQSVDGRGLEGSTVYSFIESAIGAGNLLGGFVIGLIGTRLALGRLVIVGYAVTGACVAALALTGNLVLAIGLTFGAGVGNLAFVIPSQTLVQRRTPVELMGRVLGLRFSLVFGSMTIAMGLGGILGQVFGAGPVLGFFGLVTVAAGLAGLAVPAVRDADTFPTRVHVDRRESVVAPDA
jgi:MFS family permease